MEPVQHDTGAARHQCKPPTTTTRRTAPWEPRSVNRTSDLARLGLVGPRQPTAVGPYAAACIAVGAPCGRVLGQVSATFEAGEVAQRRTLLCPNARSPAPDGALRDTPLECDLAH